MTARWQDDLFRQLLRRIETGSGRDIFLECMIGDALVLRQPAPYGWSSFDGSPPTTTNLDEAIKLLSNVFPGFWFTAGLCDLTGHASIGPDYNGPHGSRLLEEWPEADFHGGFHADLSPGDEVGRTCRALLHCMVQAEMVRIERDIPESGETAE